ncbi:MAG: MoaD/ThiS family protein [Chromatiales bacterium]|nr:MoaD/ThiS family protein [Chromatiales bacterium]
MTPIKLKLFSTLGAHLPPGAVRNCAEVEVASEATPHDVIVQYHLPEESVHLVLINGVYVAPADRSTRRLQAGDELAMWPPVAGG